MDRPYTLRTGRVIEHEWSVRLPNETQAEFASLFDANPQGSPYRATAAEIEAVRADAEFMLDKDGPSLTEQEARAYRALLRQCRRMLANVAELPGWLKDHQAGQHKQRAEPNCPGCEPYDIEAKPHSQECSDNPYGFCTCGAGKSACGVCK